MKIGTIKLADELSSEQTAADLATCLTVPLILTFSGEIGAGKTTFIRALLRTLGVKSAIKSPTFSLIETYSLRDLPLPLGRLQDALRKSYPLQAIYVHHFDLYRLHDEEELEYIGFRDYFQDNSITCIEWPERAGSSLNPVDMNFRFTVEGKGRLLTITASTTAGKFILSCLVGK